MFLFLLCLWNDILPGRIKIITETEEIVPLTSMDIKAKVFGTTASIDFGLKYKNTKKDTLVEARLVFPMDADMAVSDVVLRYDDKVFLSEAMQRQEARDVYEQQKSEKHTALLVSKSEDLLSIELCSIPPETEISISFTLYANLPVYYDALKEKFAVKFMLPTALYPSYSLTPSHGEFGEDSAPLPTKIGQPKYDFQITFEKHMDGEMECITEDVIVDQEKGTININKIPTKDFNVNIYIPDHPKTQYEIDGKHRVVNFKVNPVTFEQNEKESPPKSIVFLLDCSGSMSYEDRMINVKKSMDLFLHSLPASSKFEIVRFGSRYDSLFKTLKEYNDDTMNEALNFIRMTQASMGGTEILAPIQHILTNYKPDIIFLLTDGAVSNSHELTNYVKDFTTRIYALGVGAGADINLVRNLARFTSGTYEHIKLSNDIQSAVIRLLGDAISPFITQMKLQSNCGTLMQLAPTAIGKNSILDLYYYGTLNESSSKFCHLTISGERNGDDITIDLDSADGYQLHNSKHLFATAVVRATNDDAIDPDLGFEIARRYRVLTKKTSLILYDSEKKHDANFSETVYVPVSQYGSPRLMKLARVFDPFSKVKRAESFKVSGAKFSSNSVESAPIIPLNDEAYEDETVSVRPGPVYNVNTRSIGIETAGGIMTRIVERGEALPVKKTMSFTTAFDNQNEALIKVFEGERALAKNNHELESFVLKNIERKKQGEVEIEISVEITLQGKITITASVKNSQSREVARIDNPEHFSEEKAKADADDAAANAADDRKIRKAAEALMFKGVPCIGADYCKQLTSAQSASGEWHDIESIIRAITGKTESSKPLLSAIAIVYLEKECSSSYSLLAQKAKKFLISKYGKEEVTEMISKAESYYAK
jgi:hypothetical protein